MNLLKGGREMKIHELKIESKYFWKVWNGSKTAEIRKNDRNFQVGDTLRLHERKDNKNIGNIIMAKITDILTYKEFEGLAENYVMLSIQSMGKSRHTEIYLY